MTPEENRAQALIDNGFVSLSSSKPDEVARQVAAIAAAIREAVKAERESCAKVCDGVAAEREKAKSSDAAYEFTHECWQFAAINLAGVIRSRSENS